jgi:hypothetical protein
MMAGLVHDADIELRPSANDITMKAQDSPRVDHQMEKPYS